MQDPSAGVPQALLGHVHLQSSYSYPYTPSQLSLEQALDHLLGASRIIRELTAVAWTYLNQPADGTLLLTWQPLSQLGTQFATDGYLWAGAENTFTQEVRGYTIEIFVQDSGIVYGQDQMATHRRMRYRLVASSTTLPVDQALQIVHYIQALPEHRIPSRMFQVSSQQQNQVKERRFLETQGPLLRKEFMLNDRAHWPTITAPGHPLPGNPYQPSGVFNRPGMPHFSRSSSSTQQYVAQAQGIRSGIVGASPAKRGQAPLAQVPGAGVVMGAPFANPLADDTLESERNPEYGDVLDFLSPREISAARYKQHHEWMEEVLSSPYSAHQIMPVDLGLRLTGSLGELTEVLWDNAAMKTDRRGSESTYPTYQTITPEKLAEFNRRVTQFLQKGEEEMAEMKRVHANKMSQLKQDKLFVSLERRLAEISPDTSDERLEEIVKEVERATSSTVIHREEFVPIQSGGLLKGGEENVAPSTDEFADFTNLDTAGEALDFYENMEYPT